MNELILNAFFPGEPTTWKRADRRGKRAFTPKKMRAAQTALAWQLKAIAPHIRVDAESRFGVQMSFYLTHRGDGDNFEKLVFDALNGLVWADDEQIDEWQGKKVRCKKLDDFGLPNPIGPGIHLIVYRIGVEHAKR